MAEQHHHAKNIRYMKGLFNKRILKFRDARIKTELLWAGSKYCLFGAGVCRINLLSTWWTTARIHRTSQAANALDRPTVTSWWFHDTVAARLVVGLSPSRVRWMELASTLVQGPCSEYQRLQIGAENSSFCAQGTFSALEALRDALYKLTTTSLLLLLLLQQPGRISLYLAKKSFLCTEIAHRWSSMERFRKQSGGTWNGCSRARKRPLLVLLYIWHRHESHRLVDCVHLSWCVPWWWKLGVRWIHRIRPAAMQTRTAVLIVNRINSIHSYQSYKIISSITSQFNQSINQSLFYRVPKSWPASWPTFKNN